MRDIAPQHWSEVAQKSILLCAHGAVYYFVDTAPSLRSSILFPNPAPGSRSGVGGLDWTVTPHFRLLAIATGMITHIWQL